jgi:hypothetical protein
MGRRKKRRNQPPRTMRHLAVTPPEGHRLVQGPNFTAPSGRTPIKRLAYRPGEPIPFDPRQLIAIISHPNNAHVRYVCDANMFIAETDDGIWEALLAAQNRLVLTKPVFDELDLWLRSPSHNQRLHQAVVAAINGDARSPVQLVDVPRKGTTDATVVDYYVNLLGFRKQAGAIADEKLKERLGRPPTPQELSNYCKDVLGIRGQLLARKGSECKTPGHLLNDELMVVLAILGAVCRGHEVAILTRDEDVFEQFYKALWLIDTHYRGMLLAEAYSRDPLQFPTQRATDHGGEAFEGDLILIRKPSDTLLELLHANWTPAHLHCWLFRDTLTQLSFCAEREMQKLFAIKATTAGKNTDLLQGQNCHIYLGDRFVELVGNWAAIGKDLTTSVPDAAVELSVVDINLSLLSTEKFTRFRAVDRRQLILPARYDR